MLAALVLLARMARIDVRSALHMVEAVRVNHPFGVVFLFGVVYAASVVVLMPTLPLNLCAGVMWGPVGGGLLAAASATAGAVLSFVATRTLLGSVALKWAESPQRACSVSWTSMGRS
jgi:uncharacterized membrane protein YdjX (TVP38/TMEM64 family)